jgi:aminoglycoside phosphotransferase (APT) family kinase protein
MTEATGPPDIERIQTSTRDLDETRRRLESWLAGRLPPGAKPEVESVAAPAANGMSSETLLFDACWDEGGRQQASLVARVAPSPSAVPVFPSYDLERQYRVMDAVARHTEVPVPQVRWFEPDAEPLGQPFFVMDRVEGDVPPDVMPYNFGSWVSEATPAQQQTLQQSSVEVLAALHAIPDAPKVFAFLDEGTQHVSPLRQHVAAQRAYYEWAYSDGLRSPLLEAAFDWLDANWPEQEGPAVLSWGDARIGNMMYRDFRPVAVLDWEMAALAPREVDLGWFIYLHRFFEDIATGFGLAGMPDFLRRDDVAGAYAALTGYTPRDLDFYTAYAAIRHGIVMSRTQRRAIHFGEATMPEDVDDLIMHRATIATMLAGTYWT